MPQPLARHVRPSMDTFRALRRLRQPVRLDGLVEEWPRRDGLTLPGLRERFGDRRLPILSTSAGRLDCDVDRGVDFDTVRFADYLDQLTSGKAMDAYLVSPLDSWLPELADDIPPPIYCRDVPWRNPRLWLSAPETSVPLHHDIAQNIFIQLQGRKRFLLYPPGAAAWLYSNPVRSALANYARFDPERPDYERFPLSRAVRPIEVVLAPGEAMYLPSLWWHQVRSLDLSLSVNFWWADGAVAQVVRVAELIKRVRGLEIYGLEQRLRARAARVVRVGSDA
jgi:hypothetical protein